MSSVLEYGGLGGVAEMLAALSNTDHAANKSLLDTAAKATVVVQQSSPTPADACRGLRTTPLQPPTPKIAVSVSKELPPVKKVSLATSLSVAHNTLTQADRVVLNIVKQKKQEFADEQAAVKQAAEMKREERLKVTFPVITDDDDPWTSFKKLSTPQKIWLGVAIGGFYYLTSPARVAAAQAAPASLLGRIGITPAKVAIAAVGFVAYKAIEPKIEALTNVYTTWKPRVEAAMNFCTWLTS